MRIEKFLNESPLYNLSAAHARVVGGFESDLAGEGVHFLQALILTGLFFEERPVRPSALARTFACSKSNMSHALRGLEKKGWIERSTSASDARAYFFVLTKDGRRRVPRLIKLFDAADQRLEKRMASSKLISVLKLTE